MQAEDIRHPEKQPTVFERKILILAFWSLLTILYLQFLYYFLDLGCVSLFFFSLFLFLLLFFNIVFLKFQTLLQIFNFCFYVFVTNFVPLRTQSSVLIFTWERDYWLDCSLPLWTLLFLHQVASVSSLPPLFSTQLCESLCSRWWRTLRELITGWICFSPFHSPLLSSWPPLSPSSLFSSLYNSMNISEQSSCGVHIRK